MNPTFQFIKEMFKPAWLFLYSFMSVGTSLEARSGDPTVLSENVY